MMRRVIKAGVTALTLVLLVYAAGCNKTETQSSELRILSHSMTVHGFTGGTPQSTVIVTGRAQNASDITIRLATVAVNFYDKNKKLITTASAIYENLRPGEVWDFTVKTVSPDAWKIVSYDIAASTKQ